MRGDHAIFSSVEEVIEKMLMPYRCISRREAAQPDSQKVHVEVSNLGPGIEGWGEAECCQNKSACCYIFYLLDLVLIG